MKFFPQTLKTTVFLTPDLAFLERKRRALAGWVWFGCFLTTTQEPSCVTRDTSRKIQPQPRWAQGSSGPDLTPALCKEDPGKAPAASAGVAPAEPAPDADAPRAGCSSASRSLLRAPAGRGGHTGILCQCGKPGARLRRLPLCGQAPALARSRD